MSYERSLLPTTQNRKCGKKMKRLPAMRKGLLNAALDVWQAKNGFGMTPITRSNSSIQFWPKRRAV